MYTAEQYLYQPLITSTSAPQVRDEVGPCVHHTKAPTTMSGASKGILPNIIIKLTIEEFDVMKSEINDLIHALNQ